MVYKEHPYKGHSQHFQYGKEQTIVMHKKLRDSFIGNFKGYTIQIGYSDIGYSDESVIVTILRGSQSSFTKIYWI